MSAGETHVTELGLGSAAGLSALEMAECGLRSMTLACSGRSADEARGCVLVFAVDTIPTCPRCAVLRDEALEGRLPARKSPAPE